MASDVPRPEFRLWRNDYSTGSSRLIGNVEPFSNQHAVSELDSLDTMQGVRNFVQTFEGFFAAITTVNGDTVLISDRVSSIPLYYLSNSGGFIISDSQRKIRGEVSSAYDPVSRAEYRAATLVSGHNTLSPSLSVVQPGEMVRLSTSGVERFRHFEFEYKDPNAKRKSASELDSILTSIFKRFVQHANGRQVWIPLSGGLDSRLIALKFIELGYDNLHTYTYGRENDGNVVVSKQVADALDLPHDFVEYSHQMWRDWYKRGEFEEVNSELGLTTVPPVREYPALSKLLKAGKIENDAIIVPGYSADFLAGGHLDPATFNKKGVRRHEVVDKLLSEHYSFNELPPNLEQGVRERTLGVLELDSDVCSGIKTQEAIERWDWQERQCKYINQNIRSIELLEFEWWMPFWEQQFFDFWLEAPLDQRAGKSGFYDRYVQNKFAELSDSPVNTTNRSKRPFTKRLKLYLSESVFGDLLRPIYWFLNRYNPLAAKKAWERAPIARVGMMNEQVFREHYPDIHHDRAFRALELLGEISFDGEDR